MRDAYRSSQNFSDVLTLDHANKRLGVGGAAATWPVEVLRTADAPAVRLHSSQSGVDLMLYGDNSQNRWGLYDLVQNHFFLHVDGAQNFVELFAPAAAPNAGSQLNSQVAMWIDQTLNRLMFQVKYSDGTVKSGFIALS